MQLKLHQYLAMERLVSICMVGKLDLKKWLCSQQKKLFSFNPNILTSCFKIKWK